MAWCISVVFIVWFSVKAEVSAFSCLSASSEVNVSDNAPAGTLLNTSANLTIKSVIPKGLRSYFFVRRNSSSFLELSKSLDLEYVYKQFHQTSAITLLLRCNDDVGKPKNISVTIDIKPVNEWPPNFKKKPFHITIQETVAPGTEVFTLGDKVEDDDVLYGGSISSFGLAPYAVPAFDGKTLFSVDSENGSVVLKANLINVLDGIVQNLPFYLNITATDDGGLSGSATLQIDIEDVDNNGPVFWKKGCDGNNCEVQRYVCHIQSDYKGMLVDVQPTAVFAVDGDKFLNSSVKYEISDVQPDWLMGIFDISNNTGDLWVTSGLESIAYVTWENNDIDGATTTSYPLADPLITTITITATEDTTNMYSTNVTVAVYIHTSLSPASTTQQVDITEFPSKEQGITPATSNSSSLSLREELSSSSVIDILKIVLPVCGACLILGLVIAICLVHRSRAWKDAKYVVKREGMGPAERKEEQHAYSRTC